MYGVWHGSAVLTTTTWDAKPDYMPRFTCSHLVLLSGPAPVMPQRCHFIDISRLQSYQMAFMPNPGSATRTRATLSSLAPSPLPPPPAQTSSSSSEAEGGTNRRISREPSSSSVSATHASFQGHGDTALLCPPLVRVGTCRTWRTMDPPEDSRRRNTVTYPGSPSAVGMVEVGGPTLDEAADAARCVGRLDRVLANSHLPDELTAQLSPR